MNDKTKLCLLITFSVVSFALGLSVSIVYGVYSHYNRSWVESKCHVLVSDILDYHCQVACDDSVCSTLCSKAYWNVTYTTVPGEHLNATIIASKGWEFSESAERDARKYEAGKEYACYYKESQHSNAKWTIYPVIPFLVVMVVSWVGFIVCVFGIVLLCLRRPIKTSI